ncbi:MAG: hypothetical protein LBE36_12570 [Flavobacteriaceae bacterium]|jgi:hypothetical protein|nr:hypothetical protein [Flavobacteriaceae bacterium]
MKISVHTAWILLMTSVILMSLSVIYLKNTSGFVFIILGLSAVKFLLVAFQFMEIKKAHIFWKIILMIFITVVFTAIAGLV